MLSTYADFVAHVNQAGFLPMSGGFLEGFPSLGSLTTHRQWHTDEPETDPWQWKDRAAAERMLAFGCILGGRKGFIARWLYPCFYAAIRPHLDLEERYSYGEVKRLTLDVYALFDGGELSTAELRALINRGGKAVPASRLDRVCEELQRDFYITVCGNKRKVSAAGSEYGWPANAYCRVEDWAPAWLEESDARSPAQARERILHAGSAMAPSIDTAALEKALFGNKKR